MTLQNPSKRIFLGYVAAVPALFAAIKLTGVGAIGTAAAAESAPAAASGPFTLPELGYRTNALEPVIDAKTMEIHHGKHHKSYIDNLNKEVANIPALQGKSLEDILAVVSKHPAAVRNNAGGHWNHSFFWKLMTPPGKSSEMSEGLKTAITESFGSVDDFKKKFEEAGAKQYGSGWAWLIVNKSGKLEITATPNQDNPLMNDAKVKGTPIIGNDVWEHAYYLKHQNKRADYLKDWWKVVDWKHVSDLYEKARA